MQCKSDIKQLQSQQVSTAVANVHFYISLPGQFLSITSDLQLLMVPTYLSYRIRTCLIFHI